MIGTVCGSGLAGMDILALELDLACIPCEVQQKTPPWTQTLLTLFESRSLWHTPSAWAVACWCSGDCSFNKYG
jgi:hypothetical protein